MYAEGATGGGSRAPGDGAGLVLVCTSCEHVWEPDPPDPLDGRWETGCLVCGGWTWIGELAGMKGSGVMPDARESYERAAYWEQEAAKEKDPRWAEASRKEAWRHEKIGDDRARGQQRGRAR